MDRKRPAAVSLWRRHTAYWDSDYFSAGDLQVQRFPSHDGRFHKDDVLADILIKKIQAKLLGNCVITAGVHVDHISKEQIDASFSMTEELAAELLLWLEEHPLAKAPLYE